MIMMVRINQLGSLLSDESSRFVLLRETFQGTYVSNMISLIMKINAVLKFT